MLVSQIKHAVGTQKNRLMVMDKQLFTILRESAVAQW